jgi:RNA polymerase sigma-70 factor (ECF subfamily)
MMTSPIDRLPPPFEETMRNHEREIMRFIMRMTRDREDALDLFQETWLRAYRAYTTVDGRDGIRPWLFRIATNLCLNRARDRIRRGRVIADNELVEANCPAGAGGSHDGVIHLRSIINGLPRKQREALLMRKFGGLEYQEIGAALGCSDIAARADVYQALKKIRQRSGPND